MADLVRWYLKKQGDRFVMAAGVGAAVLFFLAIHHVIVVLAFASGSYVVDAVVQESPRSGPPVVIFRGTDGSDFTVKLEHWLSEPRYPAGQSFKLCVRKDEQWKVLERTPRILWKRPASFLIYSVLAAVAAFLVNAGVNKVKALEERELLA